VASNPRPHLQETSESTSAKPALELPQREIRPPPPIMPLGRKTNALLLDERMPRRPASHANDFMLMHRNGLLLHTH
jgi:hypothetical protein